MAQSAVPGSVPLGHLEDYGCPPDVDLYRLLREALHQGYVLIGCRVEDDLR